jgi:hypothetical protein
MSENVPHQGGATLMLAAAAPAVKLPDLATPEQRGWARALGQALNSFWGLVERIHAAADAQQPIHQVEEVIFRQLLAMGLDLLRAFLDRAGDGDAGPTLIGVSSQQVD